MTYYMPFRCIVAALHYIVAYCVLCQLLGEMQGKVVKESRKHVRYKRANDGSEETKVKEDGLGEEGTKRAITYQVS